MVTFVNVPEAITQGEDMEGALRTKIEEVCRSAGYEPVIICTPEELLEV